MAFKDAYANAVILAAVELKRMAKTGYDVEKIKLASISADPVAGAEYLPMQKPLVNTYLMRGNWNETWTFSGCDTNVPLRVAFAADGWSGARFQQVKRTPDSN